MSTIAFRDVEKRYGDLAPAVTGFTLSIRQGELVALLGPSGCGKTTTLRMAAGFIDVTHGTILFGERDVTHLAPYKRNTGMVFQSYALFPHLNVFENVAFGLRRRRVRQADLAPRVTRALARVRLESFCDRLPRQLSGGQQQRVALARALVIEPDVLLLDEPLSNLDAKLREEMRIEIRQIQQGLGVTTIFVTHDQEEALSVADRLVVMNAGRIEQIGTPVELYEAPRTAFVAGFIGKSNLFSGRVEQHRFVLASGATLWFDKAPAGQAPATLLAVRPERMTIGPPETVAAPGENLLAGKIAFFTYLGPITEYVVALDHGEQVQVHQHGRPSLAAGELKLGMRVAVRWPASASTLV